MFSARISVRRPWPSQSSYSSIHATENSLYFHAFVESYGFYSSTFSVIVRAWKRRINRETFKWRRSSIFPTCINAEHNRLYFFEFRCSHSSSSNMWDLEIIGTVSLNRLLYRSYLFYNPLWIRISITGASIPSSIFIPCFICNRMECWICMNGKITRWTRAAHNCDHSWSLVHR